MPSLLRLFLAIALVLFLVNGSLAASRPPSGGSPPPQQQAKPGSLVDRMQKFMSWMGTLKGVEIHGAAIRDVGIENGGLGLFAKDLITKDTTIVKFPKTAIVHAGIARRIAPLWGLLRDLGLGETNDLALLLVYEKFVNQDSYWKEYLDILPTNFSTPLYFSEADFEELNGSPLQKVAKRRTEALKATFNTLITANPELLEKAFPDDALTMERFLWGVSIVFSRTMTVVLKDKKGDYQGYNCIPPLIDVINTGYPDELNALCRTSEDSNFVECVAMKDINAGEEILRPYSREGLPNAEFLLDYGIAFEHNLRDKVIISLPDNQVEKKNLKEEIYQSLDPKVHRFLKEETNELKGLTLSWEKGLTNYRAFMTHLRLLSLDDKEIEDRRATIKKLNNLEPVSDRNEREAHETLIVYLRSILKGYPTTAEEDVALLEELYSTNLPANVNKKHAIISRFSEKKLIRAHVNKLKEQLAAIGEEEGQADGGEDPPVWQRTDDEL